jgi:hypothetical protein
MFSDVSLHVLYKIANAPIHAFPYPHILVRDVFPADFYQEIRAHLPPKDVFKTLMALKRVTTGYSDARLVLPLTPDHLGAVAEPYRGFWNGISSWLLGGPFGSAVISKFDTVLEQRLGNIRTRRFSDEGLLVQDYTTYSLGPHTDTPSKVLSFLFYLPADDALSHLGTSIYFPRDPKFTCKGGPHHSHELFHRVCTMPYVPNTLFAFAKTSNAFHGVEPITESGVRRDLLLYDIRVENPPEASQQAPAAAAPSRFSF